MGALFEDAAILEHNGPIGARDGAEPVGDDEGRAVADEPLQRLLHRLFRLGVQCRRGLIQDEDAWILQEGARDGDALALAAAELDPALAYA